MYLRCKAIDRTKMRGNIIEFRDRTTGNLRWRGCYLTVSDYSLGDIVRLTGFLLVGQGDSHMVLFHCGVVGFVQKKDDRFSKGGKLAEEASSGRLDLL